MSLRPIRRRSSSDFGILYESNVFVSMKCIMAHEEIRFVNKNFVEPLPPQITEDTSLYFSKSANSALLAGIVPWSTASTLPLQASFGHTLTDTRPR